MLKYRNINDALRGNLKLLLKEGKVVESRNGKTLELNSFAFQIEKPSEKFMFIPGRANNPFATIAETIWVLGGRNDVEYLEFYLPRAKDFSDDGLVWRGGYGPRIRNWQGKVDQVKEVIRLFKEDRNTRRAVIAIFDPVQDFCETKDEPCNILLTFLIRENKLHATITLRSNDAIWGFSGINAFEWSTLMELIASQVNAEVGTLTFMVGSFHLYEPHWSRAETILNKPLKKCPQDFGLEDASFTSESLDKIDISLHNFFSLEEGMRQGYIDNIALKIKDVYLADCFDMLTVYHLYKKDCPLVEMAEYLNDVAITSPVMALAGVDFFARQLKKQGLTEEFLTLIDIDDNGFLDYYYSKTVQEFDINILFNHLKILHEKKTRSYGDSWKKHGEVLGIFSNITRKYDRLKALLEGKDSVSDESLYDTLGDLLVYSVKYLTWLAEPEHGGLTYLKVPNKDKVYGNEGLDKALDWFLEEKIANEGIGSSFGMINSTYNKLSNLLLNPEIHVVDLRAVHAFDLVEGCISLFKDLYIPELFDAYIEGIIKL